MKEQIEKMAEVLRRCCDNSSKEYCNGFIDCELCEATLLYNAGYRKQSEGEWVDKKCSLCGENEPYTARGNFFATTFYQFKTNYCPNCGAKMK